MQLGTPCQRLRHGNRGPSAAFCPRIRFQRRNATHRHLLKDTGTRLTEQRNMPLQVSSLVYHVDFTQDDLFRWQPTAADARADPFAACRHPKW